MDFAERLTMFWDSLGVERRPGASPEAISAFEQRHRVVLPEDFRQFYTRFDGTAEMDSALNRYWSLDEIDRIPNLVSDIEALRGLDAHLPDSEHLFIFADHSLEVLLYAIQLGGRGDVTTPVLWIAGDETFGKIADSFTEYWMKYLDDPDGVIAP